MTKFLFSSVVGIVMAVVLSLSIRASEPLPVVPVGFDAYTMWDKWHQ